MPVTPQTFLEIRCRPVAADTTGTEVVSVQSRGAITDPECQLQSAAHVIDTDYERMHSPTTESGCERAIKQETMQSINPVKCVERALVADHALLQPCGGRAFSENVQGIIEALQIHITAQDEMITFLQRLQDVSLEDCLGRVTCALHAYSLGNGHPTTPCAAGNRGPWTQGQLSIIDCQNLSVEDGWAIAHGSLHEGEGGKRDSTHSSKLGAPPFT
ncbi:hypothetical protein HOY80DRAFT_25789 [Tuber brumale]|nr:hypothetical protein HOY80DRAFT_25789 [Tuber brumale]